MRFKYNIDLHTYEGTIERCEKVEAVANKVMGLILESGLSYDEAAE